MWFVFALGSALFAALTSILAKVGIEGVNSTLATAIRTVVVLAMSWGMVFLTRAQGGMGEISRRSWLFLILSGLATGASWLCYYRALQLGRASQVDLSRILDNPYEGRDVAGYSGKQVFDFHLEDTMDEQVLLRRFKSALGSGQKKSLQVEVSNVNRTLGTIFGSEITRKYPEGLSDDTFTVSCNGSGGQSFGAFIPRGLTLELAGDSNDYFGKGLSGGKLVVYPPKGVLFKAEENIIIGNVALYGATSGKAFINGIAGERFCVRNSGATAVVEGVGDHGCEYMTGGCVVVLGTTGKNFGAGMSGGIVYVLDEDRSFYKRLNKELVSFEEVTNKYDVLELKGLIEEHVACTNSLKGRRILEHFSEYLPRFKKVVPHDYRRMMNAIVQMEEKGLNSEQAHTQF